jgi:hypothetical protein
VVVLTTICAKTGQHPHESRDAFFLRIYGPGDYRWKGADLGVLVTKGRLQVDSGTGKTSLAILIESIRAEYAGTPITEPTAPLRKCRSGRPAELGSSPWL